MASDPSNKYTKVTKTQSMGSMQFKKSVSIVTLNVFRHKIKLTLDERIKRLNVFKKLYRANVKLMIEKQRTMDDRYWKWQQLKIV